jgi:hypothetical protein
MINEKMKRIGKVDTCTEGTRGVRTRKRHEERKK